MIHCDVILTELTWQVLTEGYDNFIFVGVPIDFWTWIIWLNSTRHNYIRILKSLNIISKFKLAQLGRHESVHTRGPIVLESQGQFSMEVPFILTLFFYLHKQYKKLQHCQLCVLRVSSI